MTKPKAKPVEPIDYTTLPMHPDIYEGAKVDAAAMKEARKNGLPIPAQPYLDELHRRHADMTTTKASGKSKSAKGSAGARVRSDDKVVEGWVRDAVLAGHVKHGSIVKFVRGAGHSASQQRMGAAFDRIKGEPAIKAAIAKAGTAPKATAPKSNVTSITKKATGTTKGTSKPTPPKPNGTTKKQTPGAKARAAAKQVTPILKGQPVKKSAPKKAVTGRRKAS